MLTVEVDRKNHLLAFVHLMHYPQKRKYTGEAYTVHLRAVAEMADKYDCRMGYEIGLCHDLLEDTPCSTGELKDRLIHFGYTDKEAYFIVNSVVELTDVFTHENYPEYNRAERKKLECERMSSISVNSQSIKYCDLIDNTKSIVENDEGFSKVYLREKFSLLQVMDKGDSTLFKMALTATN